MARWVVTIACVMALARARDAPIRGPVADSFIVPVNFQEVRAHLGMGVQRAAASPTGAAAGAAGGATGGEKRTGDKAPITWHFVKPEPDKAEVGSAPVKYVEDIHTGSYPHPEPKGAGISAPDGYHVVSANYDTDAEAAQAKPYVVVARTPGYHDSPKLKEPEPEPCSTHDCKKMHAKIEAQEDRIEDLEAEVAKLKGGASGATGGEYEEAEYEAYTGPSGATGGEYEEEEYEGGSGASGPEEEEYEVGETGATGAEYEGETGATGAEEEEYEATGASGPEEEDYEASSGPTGAAEEEEAEGPTGESGPEGETGATGGDAYEDVSEGATGAEEEESATGATGDNFEDVSEATGASGAAGPEEDAYSSSGATGAEEEKEEVATGASGATGGEAEDVSPPGPAEAAAPEATRFRRKVAQLRKRPFAKALQR